MDPKIFLRLDERDTAIRPTDAAGSLLELEPASVYLASGTVPPIVDGVTGPARSFGGAVAQHGFATKDRVSGSTLFARDVSVQAILTFDEALASGINPGTIIARGLGTIAAEYHAYALEIRLMTVSVAELRWLWQDSAGVLKTQVGGHFQTSTDFVMLTATRRWISSSEVLLRYYLADELLSEVLSADGDIGGGTTAVTSIGTRFVGAGATRWFGGKIDQLRVLDRELAPEEIAMTYRRIVEIQPNTVQLVKDCWPPGMPISASASSRVQRENLIIGNALGYAAAQAENVRANIYPTRAYGSVLEDWEETTKSPRKLADDVDTRRRRVVGRFRQELGNSVPGLNKALEELAGTAPTNLATYAFSPTTVDTWAALNTERWRHTPAAQWTINANALRVQANANLFDRNTWYTSLQPIGGDGRGAIIATKLTPTAMGTQSEAGVIHYDWGHRNAIIVGMRNAGGAYQLVREEIIDNVPRGATVIAALGGVAVPIWIILEHIDGSANYRARWSTVGATGPFTELVIGASFPVAPIDPITGAPDVANTKPRTGWAGFYLRSFSSAVIVADASFDDTTVRAPYGDRAFHFYVYRDPALPGSPDFVGGNLVISGLKHAFNVAAFVSTLDAKYDSDDTTYDGPPMGGS